LRIERDLQVQILVLAPDRLARIDHGCGERRDRRAVSDYRRPHYGCESEEYQNITKFRPVIHEEDVWRSSSHRHGNLPILRKGRRHADSRAGAYWFTSRTGGDDGGR
jgi:hypothetical protein